MTNTARCFKRYENRYACEVQEKSYDNITIVENKPSLIGTDLLTGHRSSQCKRVLEDIHEPDIDL